MILQQLETCLAHQAFSAKKQIFQKFLKTLQSDGGFIKISAVLITI